MIQNTSSAFKQVKQEELEIGEAPKNQQSNLQQTPTPQANPFYIDKIYNFQNMFLFSNTSAPLAYETPSNLQSNFLHNLYTLNAQHQVQTKAKNSFSIDSILSSNTTTKQKQTSTQQMDYTSSSLLAAHQFYSQLRMNMIPIKQVPSSANSSHIQSLPTNVSRQQTNRVDATKSDVSKSKNAKKYKCDLCGRGFSRSNTLITHRRIHTGEKPFECNICGRAFRQPGNLTRHKLTHTTIKPYSCNKCGKSFNRVSNLHAHIKIHSDGKPYVCVVCNAGFYQKFDLKIHSLTHVDESNTCTSGSKMIHECTFCKRTFKQAAHLKYHLHTHLSEASFDCINGVGGGGVFQNESTKNGLKRGSTVDDNNVNNDDYSKRFKLEPKDEVIVDEENSVNDCGLDDNFKKDNDDDHDDDDDSENSDEDDDEEDVYDSQE